MPHPFSLLGTYGHDDHPYLRICFPGTGFTGKTWICCQSAALQQSARSFPLSYKQLFSSKKKLFLSFTSFCFVGRFVFLARFVGSLSYICIAQQTKKLLKERLLIIKNVVRFPNPLAFGSDFSSQAGTLSRKMYQQIFHFLPRC